MKENVSGCFFSEHSVFATKRCKNFTFADQAFFTV